MNDTITLAPLERVATEFVYVERASRDRSLHLLLQDASARPEWGRGSFLSAAYRDIVARYQSTSQLERALTFLCRTVRTLDELSIQVETRVDDIRGLGIYLIVEEADAVYVLCARDSHARIRVGGAFLPLVGAVDGAGPAGVQEVPTETHRAQHDLFAQTLPDTLAVYRVPRPRDGTELDFLVGGSSGDLSAALDALDSRTGSADAITSDRLTRTLVRVRFDATRASRRTETHSTERVGIGHAWWRGAAAAAIVVASAVGVGLVASRVDFERAPTSNEATESERSASATQARPTPVMTRETPAEERVLADVPPVQQELREEPRGDRFALAWEQTYSDPVTSSPSLMGSGIVYGARDGRVYAVERESGEAMWSHAAVGGVGASPVVRGDAVVVADYGGNVYRLARADGSVAWKRALREKVVSTPASTGERIAVGTTRGNVYALSIETGRVLWKFATRGQVRGGIAYAKGSYFVPSHDGRLYALADDTGRKRWSVALGGPVASTPFADDTRVVVGTAQGTIVAHAIADGKRLWSFSTRGPVNSSILIHQGRVYAGSGDNRLYCLDASTGERLWSFETSGSVLSRPFVDGERVVVTSYDGSVYALNANDGTVVDRYDTQKAIFSSPVVDGDRVFFGNNGGRFFCLDLRDS